jgi:hypothetical protein
MCQTVFHRLPRAPHSSTELTQQYSFRSLTCSPLLALAIEQRLFLTTVNCQVNQSLRRRLLPVSGSPCRSRHMSVGPGGNTSTWFSPFTLWGRLGQEVSVRSMRTQTVFATGHGRFVLLTDVIECLCSCPLISSPPHPPGVVSLSNEWFF